MNTQQTSTSNPFTHEGATYKDQPPEGKSYLGSPLESTVITTRDITLEDIIYRLAEKTGRDNLNKLLSDQQKQAIIDNIEADLDDYLTNYIDNIMGECDIVEKVFECFPADCCEPTQDYAFEAV